MLLILVFGLMSTMIIPSCEGNKWIGTFKNPATCDMDKCCCPSSDLTIGNTGASTTGSLEATGGKCNANDTRQFTVSDLNANSTDLALVGVLSFDTTLTNLDVSLVETKGTSDCKITMMRQVTATIAMTVVVPTASNNNTAGGGATIAGGGTATNAGNADTTAKPKPSKASLNHDTNLIKILSIIMIIVTIIHV
ncbi:unnamed protein product [Adineta steineri]|uniref:Uncharacterized protein n=1 Tax=Adineta steineri TaxID=433720 RepID=A0A814HR74_9BILA|nr:unnamed protein product [Adineta steineri]CAF3643426.1 unnamed protein product [Adineta steineri]